MRSITNVSDPPMAGRPASSAAHASIPPVLRWAGFEHPRFGQRVRVSLAAARAVDLVTPRNLVLAGPPRSGKSSLASALFQRYLAAASSRAEVAARGLARFVATDELGDWVARSMAVRTPVPFAPCVGPLVVLDGVDGAVAHVAAVAAILEARLAEALPTWVTTALRPQAFRASCTSGAAERFAASADWLELDWDYDEAAEGPVSEEDEDTMELPSRFFPSGG